MTPTLIKRYGTFSLIFDRGAFDDWCIHKVFFDGSGKVRPRDAEYFEQLAFLGKKHGEQSLYDDFCKVYELTDKERKQSVLSIISDNAKKYETDSEEVDSIFSIMYCGMIAEENKAFTKLGKRIKRLGVHQILIDRMPAREAANFSRGKAWKTLDALCTQRGF